MKFSHNKPTDTRWGPDPYADKDRIRDFFEYRDLGIMEATDGLVNAQLVRAKSAPVDGTGWHTHQLEFHIVYMIKGWAKFMYDGNVTLVEAGDTVHQQPGLKHFLFDYSPDMEYMEIASPGNFGTKGCTPPEGAVIPHVGQWNENMKPILLWKNNEPILYCAHIDEDEWQVLNGGYVVTLNLHTFRGFINDNDEDNEVYFDEWTLAPEGKDYNVVMNTAREQRKKQ